MARYSMKEQLELLREMTDYAEQGLSMSQIAKLSGKTASAVQAYFKAHGIETAVMKQRRAEKEKVDKQSS